MLKNNKKNKILFRKKIENKSVDYYNSQIFELTNVYGIEKSDEESED